MTTPENMPDVKQVLRSFQNAASTSLHGPGPNSYPGGGGPGGGGGGIIGVMNKNKLDCHTKDDLYREVSFKKVLMFDSLKTKASYFSNDSYDSSCRRYVGQLEAESNNNNVNNISERQRQLPPPPPHPSGGVGGGFSSSLSRSSSASSSSPPTCETSQTTRLPSHVVAAAATTKEEPGEIMSLCSPSAGGGRRSDIVVVGECGVPSVCSTPSNCSGSSSSTRSSGGSCGNNGGGGGGGCPGSGGGSPWVEPGVFLAPAPFPPQPWPVLAAADKGSPGARGGRGGREETYLDGEPIACFNVGGEKRLCLPQILNTVLREFSLAQINTVCDELRIFCSRCTPWQLDALREAGVLPHTATSCGLITNTDAQRLTQALLHAHPTRAPAPAPSQPRPPQQQPQLRVYHTCFGKCKGLVWEELYNSGEAACIECEECHGLYQPTRFVCHAHRALENQTIHWGFESDNWRTYLLLAKDQRIPLDRAEAQLKAFKNKFDPLIVATHKRKQDGVEVKEELPKKVRAEEIVGSTLSSSPSSLVAVPSSVPPPPPHPYSAVYDPVLWRHYALANWTNTPLLTRDGKPLPPPPLGFVRDSVPAELPPYLSKGPPVLADPGRVVPLSDSQKFERHYQPNVALAPPKVRDKAAREALSNKEYSPKRILHDAHNEKLALITFEKGIDVDFSKENSSMLSGIPLPSSPISLPVDRSTISHQHHQHRKICSPDTSGRHPELELSTTDSDTDSVTSVNNHNETVEEAEGLLRGWSDRAAAAKVAKLVADLVARVTIQEHQIAALKQRKDAQMQDHNQTVSTLRNQLLTVTRNKDEQIREKVCVMEGELRALRDELCPRPSLSVITPTTPIKPEPSDIDIKTEPIDITDTC